MKTLTKLAVLFIITMICGNAFTQTHPFMLCNESMYDELRARASQEPWSSMKSEALIGVNSTFPSSGTAYDKHYAIRKITMCGALAYILDPANKVTYAHKVRDALLKWDETRLALAAIGVAWDEIVPPGSSYVLSIVAMDIVYNDLTSTEISSIDSQLLRARIAFYGWPLNRSGTVLVHDIYKGYDTTGRLAGYQADIDLLLRPNGIFHEGSGYAWSRVVGDYVRGSAKTGTMDIADFTGTKAFYDYPRLKKFYESSYVIAMTPFKMNTYFGDSNTKDLNDQCSTRSLIVSLYSEQAGHYNAWRRLTKTKGYEPKDFLFTYLLLTPEMLNITPESPQSDVYIDGAAGFWERNATDRSLMGVLWNVKYDYDIWTHAHKESNAIHISAYGENVIRNAGDGLYTWDATFGNQGNSKYQNCVTINGVNHNHRYGGGVTEGFTGGLVEYASGDTSTSISDANHLRNFIMVHPQDSKPGYFVAFDTVTRENNGDSFDINWHSDSNDCIAISTNTEYRWNVIKRYSNNDVTMNIFLGTAPDSVSIKDAPMMTSRYDGYVVKYIEGKYSVNSSLKKNIVTILFPSDSTHAKANMTRITGSEYSGAKIDNGDGIVDYALESSTANDVLYNNVSFNGAAALYRFNNNDLSFYFVKDGINFDNDSVPRVGFSSTADVTLYMDATEGNIVSTGADVTFYYPAITGVEVDGIAKTVIASGADWVRVNIQSGTYDISLETGIYVPPDGIIMTYLTAVGQNHAYVLTESDSTEPIYVEYGTSTSYGMTASTEDYEQASINYVHNVRLTNLSAHTLYYYRVKSGSTGEWTKSYSFLTAAEQGTSYRFAITGDSRSNPDKWNTIVNLIKNNNPEYLISLGDIYENPIYDNVKDEFFTTTCLSLIEQVPFYNSCGNHEAWNPLYEAFTEDIDGGDLGYYSYDWGDVHVIVINTERSYVVPGDLEEGGVQYEWIKNDLMNSTAIWNVAISHRPTYSIGEHGNDANMQYLNEHVFKPYGLDVTFAGHDHNYQHHFVDNIHHWVVGSTGLLNDFGYDPFPFTLSAILDYSWAIVDVTPTTFHLKAYNSNGSILEDYTISKNIDGFIQVAVISGSDDAEESEDGLSVNLTSTDLELVYDGQIQKIGMRFQNINIPQGALITRAYVQFTVDEIGSTATALSINGQNSDTALTFATIANNISNRPTTSASVIWTPAAWNTIGESGIDQQSPELKTVIQEIVDRPGWSAGNALALIITGSGSRVADSYDGSPGGAPKLIVEFSENNTTQNQAPTVNTGSDISITLPIDTLSLLGTASDDGLPNNTLTTLWSKVSGPGTVSFQDATSLTTQATFSLPGIYLLQLSADDSSLQASDTITITVNSEQSATQTVFWEAENMTLSEGYTVADFSSASGGQIIDNLGGSGAAVQTFTGTSGTYDIQVNYLDEDDGQSAFEIYVDDVLKHSWTANIDDNVWHISTVSDVTVNNGSQIKISSVRNLGEHARVDYIKFISDAPVNQAPTVDAGSDLSITLPIDTLSLLGTASDDGLPNNTLTTLWSKVSGPGNVSFQSATNLTSQATFSLPGTYLLQLSASDSSLQASDTITITVNPEPVSPPAWTNNSFTEQTDTFSVTFDMTANDAVVNGVCGLSAGTADAWSDLACIVRFNTSGTMDARNGSAYEALNALSYTAGTVYHVKLDVDIQAHTYSIYITPDGGSEITIGVDYAFRTEQNSVTALNNKAEYSEVGTLTVQNFSFNSELYMVHVPFISAIASSSQTGYPAENTFDGNFTSRWATEGDGEWLKLDMGSILTISHIGIYWFMGTDGKIFDIYTSTDGTNWIGPVYSGQSTGETEEMYYIGQQTARYVRIVGHGSANNAWNAINEVKAYTESATPPIQPVFNLSMRTRSETSPESGIFTVTSSNTEWVASETAVIIVDMWQEVALQQINERTNEMVPAMNSMLNELRDKGALIIHSPSEGGVDFYAGQAARLHAETAPTAANFPEGLDQWNYWISTAEETAGYPVDQTVCPPVDVHQHAGIEIHDNDAISTNSREMWNLMELYGIKNVIVVGVFSNVCVSGRPFGIRNWVKYGKNTLLIRDMTDVLYEDDLSPNVSHFTGADLMTAHIEKYICPTILSSDITGTSPFQFDTGSDSVLFVVDNIPLSSSDIKLRDRLKNRGYFVIEKLDEDTASFDADGKKLIVISSTVDSTLINDAYKNSAVPAVIFENLLYDDMGMVTSENDSGGSESQTEINVVDTNHQIGSVLNAGLQTIVENPERFTWSRPGANADIIAEINGDSTAATVFCYDQGISMPGLTAPARRVGGFLYDTVPDSLNTDGWNLFDAMVDWAVGEEIITTTWTNNSFTEQTDSFSASFDMTPNNAVVNGVCGLSTGVAYFWSDLACIVRFNTSGEMDARNGSAYEALNVLAYTAGTIYHVRLDVDIQAHTYSIYVTPDGGSEITIGVDYAFRTEQNSVTALNNKAEYSDEGTLTVQNFSLAPPAVTTSTGVWTNNSVTTQTDTFSATFDMIPNDAMMDGVCGLSAGTADAWSDLACIVRFNTNGEIDARNGAVYQALNVLSYTAGTTYHVRLEVDIQAHTYSIYITPDGGSEVTIGTNYAFRPEQDSVTTLNNKAEYSAVGTFTVQNFSF